MSNLSEKNRYKLLFDNMSQAFALHEVICDGNGQPIDYRFLEVNPAFERLTGLKRSEIINKRVKEIFPATESYWIENFGRVAQTSNPIRFENFSATFNQWYEVYAYSPFPGQFAVIFVENTQRKKAQAALLETQKEMARARRLSDIGILAATVAHELRNPLAAIGMAAYNIKRKAQNLDIDKHLFHIEKKVKESDSIINNLLFYSRLKLPHYESVNISDIIEKCLELVDEQKKGKVKFIKNLHCLKNVIIQADPLQIKEIFNNILNNALDALALENGWIEISAENKDTFIKVVIEDNGTGIAKDVLDKIFDPFFTTKAKGTGLGLAVCKQIINMHEGKIYVKSPSQQGTCVIVILPKEIEKNKKLELA